jgi:uncharacterized protein YecE (DUF72 family)
MASLYAGTSGFAYTAWRPAFYPEKLPQAKFLSYYAGRLNAVEINYTFRRAPSAVTLENWAKATPAGFVFSLKAHQRITHVKRLKDAGPATELFFKSIDPLRCVDRLGPVLFQLPPNLKCDRDLLASFLKLLPADVRCAFEFRHSSWLIDEVYELLRQHGVSLCVAESTKLEVPEVITAGFVYYRLRMPEYSDAEVDAIAANATRMVEEGRDLYLFFKHEDDPAGALNAEKVLQAVSRPG